MARAITRFDYALRVKLEQGSKALVGWRFVFGQTAHTHSRGFYTSTWAVADIDKGFCSQ